MTALRRVSLTAICVCAVAVAFVARPAVYDSDYRRQAIGICLALFQVCIERRPHAIETRHCHRCSSSKVQLEGMTLYVHLCTVSARSSG